MSATPWGGVEQGLIIGPDELLVLRVSPQVRPEQIKAVREYIDARWPEYSDRIMIIACDELALVQKGPA